MVPWVAVGLVRLVVPLLILRWPLFGVTAAFLADTLDVVALDFIFHVSDYSIYNQLDKLLDTYMYLVIGFTAFRWPNRLASKTALVLLAYRMVGVALYELTGQRALLLVFPDLFIFYVFFYLITDTLLRRDYITSAKANGVILLVLLVPKLFQEYELHVAQFPIYGWIREHILRFG